MQRIGYGTIMDTSPTEPESSNRPAEFLRQLDSSFGTHAKEDSKPAALDGGASSLHGDINPEHAKMVSLSPADHAHICQAIGGTTLDETHSLLHTRSFWWPPKGLPDGLYKDVITSRFLNQCRFYFCSVFFNGSLIFQLVIGAIITALAASKPPNDEVITIIAACNTVNAGILALMHNSGVPDRYKNDMIEFEKVEMFLEELMYGGIVREGITKEYIIADCYDRYAKARSTQTQNKPSTYTGTSGSPPSAQR